MNKIFFINQENTTPMEYFDFIHQVKKTNIRIEEVIVVDLTDNKDLSFMKSNQFIDKISFSTSLSECIALNSKLPMYFNNYLYPVSELESTDLDDKKEVNTENLLEFFESAKSSKTIDELPIDELPIEVTQPEAEVKEEQHEQLNNELEFKEESVSEEIKADQKKKNKKSK